MTKDRTPTGTYIISSTTGEKVKAFVPDPLPPKEPIRLSPTLEKLMEDALLALGGLNFVSTKLPDTSIFLFHYVRKEALLSSQIEGTQSSLSELLLFELEEAPGVPTDDVTEVSNYVAALTHGMDRMRDPNGLPLSLRLLREMHGILLRSGRGSDKEPGEFRRSQNWIGGTRPGTAVFVPPPPEKVADLMSALEQFLQMPPGGTPSLIKAALAHVQFETIHPFLDGNGRIGRLLIALILANEGVVYEPLLYLSLFFKNHRQEYYDLLGRVRLKGDWTAWVEFFLTGVKLTADQAADTATRLEALFASDRQRIQGLGASAGTATLVYQAFVNHPLLSIASIRQRTGKTHATVNRSIEKLEGLDVVREVTGKRRGRLYSYSAYLDILSEGTEPL